MNKQKGFTLIELLVVVLIIGILAAIALPQYQKAVRKTKFTQNTICANALLRAVQEYRLANNEWPPDSTDISELAEVASPSSFYVNRRNKSTETAVLICNHYEMFISDAGRDIQRFCRAKNDNSLDNQVCKSLTGTSTPVVQGDWLLYEYQ